MRWYFPPIWKYIFDIYWILVFTIFTRFWHINMAIPPISMTENIYFFNFGTVHNHLVPWSKERININSSFHNIYDIIMKISWFLQVFDQSVKVSNYFRSPEMNFSFFEMFPEDLSIICWRPHAKILSRSKVREVTLKVGVFIQLNSN